MKKWLVIGSVLLCSCSLMVGSLFYNWRRPIIDHKLLSEIDFPIYYPVDQKTFPINRKSVIYDPAIHELSYSVQYLNNTLSISEQKKPKVFVLPSLEQQFKAFRGTSQIMTKLGKVELLSSKLDGQIVVLVKSNELIFAQSNQTLGEVGWQYFFNGLILAK